MTISLLLSLGLAWAIQTPAPDLPPVSELPPVWNGDHEEGADDPHTRPYDDGVVWYGVWEDAMAEVARTGKPIMLHMGCPRERNTCVPGTW